jgi:hypothetical protein
MFVVLDAIDGKSPDADIVLSGERDGKGDCLRITLNDPPREIVIRRADLMQALPQLWRES